MGIEYYRNTKKYYLDQLTQDQEMTTVVVTRKGQTTIPKELRQKYEMFQGTKLEVFDTGDGILFRKSQSTIDLIASSKRSYDETKRRLDEIRREDA